MCINKYKDKLESRKELTREAIINNAIKLYKQKSSTVITLEIIAETAGVSRKTFYNYFNNNEQIIFEILSPILNDGRRYLDMISEKEVILMEDMWNLCLYLWKEHKNSLDIVQNIDFSELYTVLYIHTLFLKKFTETFERMIDLPADLKIPYNKLTLIVFKTFIPIISKFSDIEGYESLYKNAMNGMVRGLTENIV